MWVPINPIQLNLHNIHEIITVMLNSACKYVWLQFT